MLHRDFTKIAPAEVNWPVLYDVISACGKSHNPRSFCMDILENIGQICPFDQALLYMFDANHKLFGHYLKNVEEKYNQSYMAYCEEEENPHYNIFRDFRENPSIPTINVHDWDREEPSEFLQNHVRAKGLRYSVGFALFDLNASIRVVVSLDRLSSNAFTNRELYNLQLAVNMLNDLNKNFFYRGDSLRDIKQTTWQKANLTAREIEVVDLLAQGVSPANISKILYVSLSTTYKHIAHIYNKMGVSTQQELLVKLLRQSDH